LFVCIVLSRLTLNPLLLFHISLFTLIFFVFLVLSDLFVCGDIQVYRRHFDFRFVLCDKMIKWSQEINVTIKTIA
jgi:hypothetical protein